MTKQQVPRLVFHRHRAEDYYSVSIRLTRTRIGTVKFDERSDGSAYAWIARDGSGRIVAECETRGEAARQLLPQ